MTLLEIGTFTGFTPAAASIERLRAAGAGIVRRVDVDDRKVILYAEELPADNTTLCVRFRATRTHEVANAKRQLAESQAEARRKLSVAKSTRTHNDEMVDALRAKGVTVPSEGVAAGG